MQVLRFFYPLSRSDKEVEGAGNSVPCRGIGAMRPLCGNQHGGNWKLQGAEGDYARFPDWGEALRKVYHAK